MNDTTRVKTETRYADGKVVSSFQGHPDIDLAGMTGISNRPDAWSPPHLLVAAAESCIILTMLHAAERMHIEIKGYSSTAEGTLSSADDKHMEFSEIVVRPSFDFANAADRSRIPQLIKVAEEYCPVGRTLKCPVRIEIA